MRERGGGGSRADRQTDMAPNCSFASCLFNAEEVLAGTEIPGTEIPGGGGRGIIDYIYLTLHCHRQNDSCIKMASGVSHFNVSFTAEKQSHYRTLSMNRSFRREMTADVESN